MTTTSPPFRIAPPLPPKKPCRYSQSPRQMVPYYAKAPFNRRYDLRKGWHWISVSGPLFKREVALGITIEGLGFCIRTACDELLSFAIMVT